jgi:NADH-quinone oxidoreductase subunit F
MNGGSGPKLYGVSGQVKRPGMFELPMGTSVRELIFDQAGGLEAGRSLLGFLPGGASTPFLGPENLDLPMNFDTVAQAGSRLGTGTIIVLDDSTCPVRVVLNLMRFFARESCGFCTPCRDGFPYLVDILERIETGSAGHEEIDRLSDLCDKIAPHSFCAFAPGGIMPLKSSLVCFGDIYEQHLHGSGCPFDQGWRA